MTTFPIHFASGPTSGHCGMINVESLTFASPELVNCPGCVPAATRAVKAERRTKGLCPTCGKTRLTRKQIASGYQCNSCADTEEGAF